MVLFSSRESERIRFRGGFYWILEASKTVTSNSNSEALDSNNMLKILNENSHPSSSEEYGH
jgi:hypothetical protein